METRRLGKDGPSVPIICFGALPIGGGMGLVPEEEGVATVQAAIDAGMTFIDTAQSYGPSELLVGKAIEGRRPQLFLATKLSGTDHSPERIVQALEDSLKTLGTDYVDLYQIHKPQPDWPIEQTMENLLRLRDSGKIRYIGICNFSAAQTLEAIKYGPVHSSQPRYNMLFRDAEGSVLPCSLEHGIGVIPHSVLCKGMLSGRYRPGHQFLLDDERHRHDIFQGETFEKVSTITEKLAAWAQDNGRDLVQLAIAWTLAHPSVTSAIVGAKTPEQVYNNANAAELETHREGPQGD